MRKLDIPVSGALSSSKTSASQYGTLYDCLYIMEFF